MYKRQISFRDPPAYLEPAFEPEDISVGELNAQGALLSALASKGNIATRVSPHSSKVAVVAPIPDATTPRPVLVVNQPSSSNVDPPLRPPRTDLPDTLTLEDVKDGVRGPKEAALRRCRALASDGESVVLKLLISGPDGSIRDAVPMGESQNAELTQCVARELRSATFRKVQKLQIATQIRVAF